MDLGVDREPIGGRDHRGGRQPALEVIGRRRRGGQEQRWREQVPDAGTS
ncbi:MAG: hypothetical protein R3B06_30465 [Kofleriaceae bacterium]